MKYLNCVGLSSSVQATGKDVWISGDSPLYMPREVYYNLYKSSTLYPAKGHKINPTPSYTASLTDILISLFCLNLCVVAIFPDQASVSRKLYACFMIRQPPFHPPFYFSLFVAYVNYFSSFYGISKHFCDCTLPLLRAFRNVCVPSACLWHWNAVLKSTEYTLSRLDWV